jgi:hypothetical protein
VDQGREAYCIKLVCLVDVAHDDLCFGSVGQLWNAPGLLDLIDDPVVVADGFKSDGGSFWKTGKELKDSAGVVIDPCLFNG